MLIAKNISYLDIFHHIPEGYYVEVIEGTQSLALLTITHDRPHVAQLSLLTDAEWRLFNALSQTYPHYCSYVDAMAAVTMAPRDDVWRVVSKSLEDGTKTETLRVLRSTLYRLKQKLKAFSISISSVHETGYILLHLQ